MNYYSKAANSIVETLRRAEREMTCKEMLSASHVNAFLALSVLPDLISEKKISYRIENGKQLFRLNQ